MRKKFTVNDNIEAVRLTDVRILSARNTSHRRNITLGRAAHESIVQNTIPGFGPFLLMANRSSLASLSSVPEAIRVRYYSMRTEVAYIHRISGLSHSRVLFELDELRAIADRILYPERKKSIFLEK
ncbi:MAG: hypothetical protein ACU843_01735 [Gammaproteobacteria bacterium]